MKSVRGEPIDFETITDPFALIAGARSGLDGLRVFLMDADDNRGGWRDVLRDEETRRVILNQLAGLGLYMAQLTKVITDDPTQRELLELDVMQAALEIEAARAEVAERDRVHPRHTLPGTAETTGR